MRVQTNISKAFGIVVLKRRELLGYSQERLAENAGIHRTYVSRIELGKVRLGLDVAKKVSDALNATLAQLIAEAEEALD